MSVSAVRKNKAGDCIYFSDEGKLSRWERNELGRL